MALMITSECINCDSCIDECPATAIVSADSSPSEYVYIKPDKCIECVDCTVPKCVDICPTSGAIVWDMPYIQEYEEYFLTGHNSGKYQIKEHAKKGLMLPSINAKPFRDTNLTLRENHAPVES